MALGSPTILNRPLKDCGVDTLSVLAAQKFIPQSKHPGRFSIIKISIISMLEIWHFFSDIPINMTETTGITNQCGAQRYLIFLFILAILRKLLLRFATGIFDLLFWFLVWLCLETVRFHRHCLSQDPE